MQKMQARDNIPETTLCFVVSVCIIASISNTLAFNRSLLWILASIISFMLLYIIISLNRISIVISLSVAVLTILVFLLHPALRSFTIEFFSTSNGFWEWVVDYSSGIARYEEGYATFLMVLITAVTVFFIFMFTMKKFSFLFVLTGGMAFFIVQWINKFLIDYKCFYIFIASSIMYYILHVYRSFSSKDFSRFAPKTKVFIWSIPISLVIVAGALLIPHSSDPIKWDWMDRKIDKFVDYWNNSFARPASFEYFSVATTGFGNNSGYLGGKVKADDTLVLNVISEYPVYLKGIAASIYSDNRWHDMQSFSEYETYMDMIKQDCREFHEGLILFSDTEDLPPGVMKHTTVHIEFENLKTKSLFIPPKLSSINLGNYKTDLLCSAHGAVSANTSFSKGFGYEAKYIHMDYNDPELKEILRKSYRGLYVDEYLSKDTDNYSLIIFNRIARQNYDNYLQIPDDFPERIGRLAREITWSLNNDYDKVKAIESYLSGNFTYTLEPPTVPQGRDFVDYFLFDGKEGYCTYFSTAMTMMVRTIGIPSRYVEGYILPNECADEDSNLRLVTNRNAHAWVEVYFEGAGWITFEPTSPFTADHYANSYIATSVDSSPNDGMHFMDDEIDEYHDNPSQTGINFPDDDKNLLSPYIPILIPIGICVFIVLFLVMLNTIKYKIVMHRITVSHPRNAVLNLFRYYFKFLSMAGYPMKQGETVSEYAERIEKFIILPVEIENPSDSVINMANLEKDKISEILKLFDVFTKARYSTSPISEEDREYTMSFLSFFTQEAKNERKSKFIFLRYFLGHI